MTIPTLETDRLILRAHRMADFDAYAEMWAEPDVVRFIGGLPLSREQAWVRFLRQAGCWHHMGFGFLALEERATGRFIGEAGLHELRRAMTPPIEGSREAGWGLIGAAQRKGYAFEAMSRILAWADEALMPERTTCIIEPANRPSILIAERLGFRPVAEGRYGATSMQIFER